MKEMVEKIGVIIEILPALIDEKVPGHVTKKESHQHDAGDSHDQFLPNRGIPESAECFAKRVHLRFLKQYDGSLQGVAY
jgi:hypothetical protein